jgi:serine/threonine protein phosphatase PrpC
MVVCGVVSTQGRRPQQEDFFFVDGDGDHTVVGVFDGHAGEHAAKHLQQEVPSIVRNALVDGEGVDGPRVCAELVDLNEKFVEDTDECVANSGSTLCVVVIATMTITCFNAGDSRAILVYDDSVELLSVPHSAYAPSEAELERVSAAGGFIFDDRLCGLLAMTRAFGDAGTPGLTAEPEVQTCTVTGSSRPLAVVVATDGLWDVMSAETAAKIIRMVFDNHQDSRRAQLAADKLNKVARAMASGDNLTVIVADLTLSG